MDSVLENPESRTRVGSCGALYETPCRPIAVSALVGAMLMVSGIPVATAERKRVAVLSVEGKVVEGTALAVHLNKALVHAVKKRKGVTVQKSRSTLADLALMSGCAVGSADCRIQMVGALLVDEIVGCKISRSIKDGKLRARLTHISDDGRIASHVLVLDGSKPQAQAASLRKQAPGALRGSFANSVGETRLPTTPIETDAPLVETRSSTAPKTGDDPRSDDTTSETPTRTSDVASEPEDGGSVLLTSPGRDRTASIRKRTWLVLGAGVGFGALGGVALTLARSRQGDIDEAPVSSEADLIRLEELEDSARWRYRLANVAGIAATTALITGAVMVGLDIRAAREHRVVIGPTTRGSTVGLSVGGQW